MEFWGVEVKAGEPISVVPESGNVVHLSQAVLGESKKAADNVVIYGKIGEQKLVLGHLIPGQIPQLSFDLVFDDEFELSHNGKNGSVHFAGYQSVMEEEDLAATDGSEDLDDSSSEEEEEVAEPVPVMAKENGKIEKAKAAPAKSNAVKPESSGKKKVKIEEPIKDEADEDDSDSEMGDSMDEDSSDDEDDSEDSEEEDEDEETPTPKKKPESKKRAQVSGSEKTPVSAKKAKLATGTPQKTDGKKGGHTDTPHPAKKGKTPATEKSKAQTPKSAGGSFSCGSCSKTFGSDGALQSHSMAKHSAGK